MVSSWSVILASDLVQQLRAVCTCLTLLSPQEISHGTYRTYIYIYIMIIIITITIIVYTHVCVIASAMYVCQSHRPHTSLYMGYDGIGSTLKDSRLRQFNSPRPHEKTVTVYLDQTIAPSPPQSCFVPGLPGVCALP